MRMQTRLLAARYWIGALACAGIAGAHWLAYLIAGAHAHTHSSGLLSETGHAYWPAFAGIAMAAVVAGLGFPAMQRIRNSGSALGASSGIATFAFMALLQLGGFSLLELGERFLFVPGHSLNLAAEPVFWWGLALQVLVAGLAALVLRVLLRFVDFIVELRTKRAPTATATIKWFVELCSRPTLAPATGGSCLRGPPVL
jgi:hypothetical protein